MPNVEAEPIQNKHLEMPLANFSGAQWTIGHAVEGVQIFGGIGSGKTTGSGKFLALKYLSAGFGGLVLTVKPDERALWEKYARLTGRTNDLIIVEPGGANSFNFLEYESARGDTQNVLQVLKTVIRAGEEKSAGAAQDPFWESSLEMLISHVIDLCKLAYGRVTVREMYDIVQSLPRQGETRIKDDSAFGKAMLSAIRNIDESVAAWESGLPAGELDRLTASKDGSAYEETVCDALDDARLFRFVESFFLDTYRQLAEKTRSIIDLTFSGFLFGLLRDPVYTLFCRGTSTVTPEDCFEGKIIVIDLPVKLYHKIGRDSQILMKYVWQRAVEKRAVGRDDLPVFLWADEAQHFLHEYDAEYQATARSSLIATVYLTQNVANYHANMGGSRSEFRVKSFLGTLATKFFHSNADIDTNRYASDLIGDGLFEEISTNETISAELGISRSTRPTFNRLVRPEKFLRLKTGGARNGWHVSAYVHFQGNIEGAKHNVVLTTFGQKNASTNERRDS